MNKNMNNVMKWVYTFVLLIVTIAWSVFSVIVVKGGMTDPNPVNVIEAAGVSVVLGALISMNVTVNQHWFRKKDAE